MRLLPIAKYIEELAKRDYYPIVESATQTYTDIQILSKTAIRSPTLSADQAEESIGRLDSEIPCTGFVEYFLDFFGETVFYNPKTHGKGEFNVELHYEIKWNFQTFYEE